jgi:hypothetical protein
LTSEAVPDESATWTVRSAPLVRAVAEKPDVRGRVPERDPLDTAPPRPLAVKSPARPVSCAFIRRSYLSPANFATSAAFPSVRPARVMR